MIQFLTRSGQGLTFLYLSFFEPDTTVKCMNEVLYLLSLPSLDYNFRDPETNKQKKELVFVVDKGPQEKPSNPIVQMCLARLLSFLKLDKISQISFAEYHSKHNFVEWVHAEENRVLSTHGPFTSKGIHKNPVVGSVEHKENMEHMAEEVKKCLQTATFGGMPLECHRGLKCDKFLFNDESKLKTFLSLSEEGKTLFDETYSVNKCDLLTALHCTWGVDLDFQQSYKHDYALLTNKLTDERTSWEDKYTTSLFSPLPVPFARKEAQPLPDYLRWVDTCELHFMTLQKTSLLEAGPWDNIPGMFLPSNILDLCFLTIPSPSSDIP